MVQKSDSFNSGLAKSVSNNIKDLSPNAHSDPHVDVIVPTLISDHDLVQATNSSLSSNVKMANCWRKLAKIPGAGIFLAACSGMFFATGSLIVKLVHEIHPVEIVVMRSLLQALVYLVPIISGRLNPLGIAGERFALFMRCFNGFIAVSCAYLAFRKIPLGDASSIVFSSPIFVTVLACLLLNEPCGLFQVFTLVLGITGIVLICKPSFLFSIPDDVHFNSEDRLAGTLFALVASLCAALVFCSMRSLRKTPPSISIFGFSMFSVVLGSVALIGLQEFQIPKSPQVWFLLLANGICGVFGQLLLTVSLKIENAGPVSLARTTDIVIAFVFQAFLLNQKVQITSIVGAFVICFSVILVALDKWYQQRPELFKGIVSYKNAMNRLLCPFKRSPRKNTPTASVETSSTQSVLQIP